MVYDKEKIISRIKQLQMDYKMAYKQGRIGENAPAYFQNVTLANELGVESRTLYNYLNGKQEIPLKLIIKIADIFRCEVGYVIGEFDSKTKEVSTIRKATGLSDTTINILKKYNDNKPYFDNDIFIINRIIEDIEDIEKDSPFNSIIAYLDAQKRIEAYKCEDFFEGRIDFGHIVDIVHNSSFYKEVYNYGVYDIGSLADQLHAYGEIIREELKAEGYTDGQINYLSKMTRNFYMDYFESEVTQKYILGDIANGIIAYLKNFDFEEVLDNGKE